MRRLVQLERDVVPAAIDVDYTRSKRHRIATNDPTAPIDGTRRRRVMTGGTGNQDQHGN